MNNENGTSKTETLVDLAAALDELQGRRADAAFAVKSLDASIADVQARLVKKLGFRMPTATSEAPKRARAHVDRGPGGIRARILAELASGPKRFWEIRDVVGETGSYLGDMVKSGKIARLERGLYSLPSVQS